MLQTRLPLLLCGWLILADLTGANPQVLAADSLAWKAGIARAKITPQKPMWMAGYGSRTAPAESTYHDLWIRVVALEADNGHKAVILSSDTLGMSKPVYEDVVAGVKKFGLTRDQIMLNASHTHCGPVLKNALYDTYPLDEAQIPIIEEYSAWLVETIVTTIGQALDDLKPATVSRGVGNCEFAVNRRTNREPDVPMLREKNLLMGPVDHTVPVLKIEREGQLAAVVFAYACHNTVLSFQQWCGDYAGFAQYALEERHPGAAALFVMGCGGDQNPLPRRTVELAQGYGNQLADSVDAVLKEPMTPVVSKLYTEIDMVSLEYGDPPSIERLTEMAKGPANYQQRWAARNLKLRQSPGGLRWGYGYPTQAWRLGDDLIWVALGGEVVVDYALKLKAIHGDDTWVTAYANDVMAYIPSKRVLLEGGYEGQSSMYVYGHPAERWCDDIEDRVTNGVQTVVNRVTKFAPK
ncbi:hypothetical protein GC163_03515 [bacterium]|nr:hypothetical protein [bacterium]